MHGTEYTYFFFASRVLEARQRGYLPVVCFDATRPETTRRTSLGALNSERNEPGSGEIKTSMPCPHIAQGCEAFDLHETAPVDQAPPRFKERSATTALFPICTRRHWFVMSAVP